MRPNAPKNHFFSDAVVVAVAFALSRSLLAAPVSLDDCLHAAEAQSLPLAALRAQIRADGWSLRKDEDSLKPGLSLSDSSSYSTYGPDASFAAGPENQANAELSWDLQNWRNAPQKTRRLALRRDGLLLKQAQIRLRQDLRATYTHLVLLQRQAAENAQAATYVDDHIKDIEHLKASGLDVALDLLRAQSQRKALSLTAGAQQAETLDGLEALRSLTGLTLSAQDLDVAGTLDHALTENAEVAIAPASLTTTLQSSLNALDLEGARLATLGSGRFALPTLRVGLDHSFISIDPSAPVDRGYAALNFDAFDWGQRAAESRQSQAELDAQGLLAQERARQLRLSAIQLSTDIRQARQAYAQSLDLVTDAQKAMEIAKTYYRQGKIRETDLLGMLADYLTATSQRDQALLDALDKQSQWDALWEGGRS